MRIIGIDKNSLTGNTSSELGSENLLNNSDRLDSGTISIDNSEVRGSRIGTIGAVVLNPIDKNPIPIIKEPIANGTINSDIQYVFRISSNVEGASILVDGENTFKTTPNTTKITLSDVAVSNVKTIEIQKQGFISNEKYEIDLVPNPEFGDIQFRAISEMNERDFSFDRFGNEIRINANDRLQLSSVSPFVVRVKYFADKMGDGIVTNSDYNEKIKQLEFTQLKKRKPIQLEEEIDESSNLATLTIRLNGPDGSVSLSSGRGRFGRTRTQRDEESTSLKSGINKLSLPIGTTMKLISSNTERFRVTKITPALSKSNPQSFTEVLAGTDSESASVKFVLENNYAFDVESTEIPQQSITIPTISFTNESAVAKYNINEKSDLPIGLTSSSPLNQIVVSVEGQKYTFNKLSGTTNIVTIPAKVFSRIGRYKLIIVGTLNGIDSAQLQTTINVVNESYVGTPDIIDIKYPSMVRGADYAGTNVDFIVSWDSVNTDYVILGKDGTELATKVPAKGQIKLNFAELLKLGGSEVSQNDNLISVVLKLTPYNDSGIEKLAGKTEIFNVKFEKSNLSIPRDSALNRLADAFLSQLNDDELTIDSSKYLTHLLHFGDGDNKVVTTWVGSEGSLILKLYEPLPTSVQPNDLVWISKLQSNPIVETISISGVTGMYCPPLKGPNFSLEPDNGIGYKVFDDLTASGSISSIDLINKYTLEQGIDTSQLNIQYVSGSEYIFENFSNFGSIEERVNNFFYKIGLLQSLQLKYESLTGESAYGGDLLAQANTTHETYLTLDGYQVITEDGIFDVQWEQFVYRNPNEGIEAEKTLKSITEILKGWDGFETWLYKSTNALAYPKTQTTAPNGLITYVLKATTNNDAVAWYESLVAYAAQYDKNNPNYLVNNIPEFIKEDYNNQDFITFLDMVGNHFDIIWSYINGLKKTKIIDERSNVGVSDKLVWHLLESFGWTGKRAYDSQFLWEYAFGTDREGFQKYRIPLEQANNEVWRRIANNIPYLLKHKGTARAMKAALACYGVPSSLLTIMEFGGPQDPSAGGSSKFTFDDRTAAIYLEETSKVIVPWKTVNGTHPTTIEFAFKPDSISSTPYTLISASEWKLELVQTTGSLGKLQLNFGGDLAEAAYFLSGSAPDYPVMETSIEYVFGPDLVTGSLDFPISTEDYSNVCINRTDYGGASSLYEVWLATSNGDRIVTSVSMSIFTDDNQWLSGSQIGFGGDGFVGNLDEFRLWRIPLQRSKFETHALQPDSIAGNSYSASTEDLLFRLDFERPKDRTKTENVGILNVAINQTYGETYASASNFYSASSYPYQYTPYERTVTATVPSTGMTLSNKIRFEEQTLVSNLSHKVRATQKSFDRAPIDSSRLGLFFSPIKELNMDIIKSFGEFNIDNYIGNPSDEYKDSYTELEGLRTYYFERLDRDINEYISLVRYIDKSLFDVLADLAPARAKVSKGLLIEPHYLERSKTRWDKPVSQRNDFETFIDTNEDVNVISTYNSFEANLDVDDSTQLTSEFRTFVGTIDENETLELVATAPFYDGLVDYNTNELLEGSYPTYETNIFVPNGASLTGEADAFSFEAIGMDGNSLANLGFGLYAENGVGIWRRYDVFGNVTQSRQNMYVVREQYTKRILTQTAGYPTNGALPNEQIVYERVPVVFDKYRVSLMPFSGSIEIGNEVVDVTTINGYLPTHYKFKNNLSEGLQLSYFKGSKQTAATTPDGLSPVETFSTNANILRVAKTGRGSGEPILEVD
jgi:hypothetical protein